MKKLLLITDSLGIPRTYPEIVMDDDCWTHKIAHSLPYKTYIYSREGMTSKKVVNDLTRYLSAYEPDVVILQIGVVDCAPRALSYTELKIIRSIPIFNKYIHKIIKKYHTYLIKKRKIVYTSKCDFRENISKIKSHYKNKKVIIIPICQTSDEHEKKIPGFKRNVSEYNKILKEFDSVLNPYGEHQEILMSDGHHINNNGNNLVYKCVQDAIYHLR